MTNTFKLFIIIFSAFIFTACGDGNGKGSTTDTTAEQNDYRLVLEVQKNLSSDYYTYYPYYGDHNITYTYDDKNDLIQIATYNKNGSGSYMNYVYNNDHIAVTTTHQFFYTDGIIETYYKTESSGSRRLIYENRNYLTDGIDSIMTETLQDGKRVRLSFDGYYDIAPDSKNMLNVDGYTNKYDPYDDTTYSEYDGTIDVEISFVYNDKGQVVQKLFDSDADGNFEHNVTFEYDQGDDPVYAIDTDGNYESFDSNCTEDNFTCYAAWDKNGSVTLWTSFLNDQHKTVKENRRYPQGNETNTTYTYTRSGDILTKTVISDGEEDYSRYTYDESGNITHFESTFESIIISYVPHTKYHYLSVLPFLNNDFVVYDFTYDANGNMIKQIIYDNPNAIPTVTVDYTWEKAE